MPIMEATDSTTNFTSNENGNWRQLNLTTPEPHSDSPIPSNPTPPPSSSSSISSKFIGRESDSSSGAPSVTSPNSIIITPCLLCNCPVKIYERAGTGFDDEDDETTLEEANERGKQIRNLCHHMHLELNEIPRLCSEEMFPQCKPCYDLINLMWESEKRIQEAQKTISLLVIEVERKVADAEIIMKPLPRSTGTPQPQLAISNSTDKRFTKLREMIYEGYKKKLMLKQKLKENLVESNLLTDEHLVQTGQIVVVRDTPIQNEGNIKRELGLERELAEEDSASSSPSSSILEAVPPLAIIPVTNTAPTHAEVTPGEAAAAALQLDPNMVKVEEVEDPGENVPTTGGDNDNDYEMDGGLVGLEYQGTSHLPNPPAELVPNDNGYTPTPMPTLKRELPIEKNEDGNPSRKFPQGARKPRSYEGVRFYQISRTPTNPESLQCGACSFSLNATRYRTEGKLPILTIRQHILKNHLGNNTQRPAAVVAALIPNHVKQLPQQKNSREGGRSKTKGSTKATAGVKNTLVEKTLPCPLCDRMFARKCNLGLHLKQSHSKKEGVPPTSESFSPPPRTSPAKG